jgi:hypothetical protein
MRFLFEASSKEKISKRAHFLTTSQSTQGVFSTVSKNSFIADGLTASKLLETSFNLEHLRKYLIEHG